MTGPTPYTHLAGYDYPVASLARHLLSTIEATYGEHGTELPERRYIAVGSLGTAAVDKEQLVVMFGGVVIGPPGNEQNAPLRGDTATTANFNVELWRDTPSIGPNGKAPDTDRISAAAEVAMNDCWLLTRAGFASDPYGVGIIASAGVNAPQGGLEGVSLIVEIQIP